MYVLFCGSRMNTLVGVVLWRRACFVIMLVAGYVLFCGVEWYANVCILFFLGVSGNHSLLDIMCLLFCGGW